MRTNFTRKDELEAFLETEIPASPFVLNLPRRLAEKIEKGNPKDPLFLQFVPTVLEQAVSSGFTTEPVQDSAFRCSERLLQKYEGRALLVATSACAMHCRYCFRQNHAYQKGDRFFESELDWIENNRELHEVILSGGDPLSLDDGVLRPLLQRLDRMEHITSIRFHTRFLIGIPERIDASFLSLLASIKTQIWFVVHCNHPRELDAEVLEGLKAIRKLGIPLLNQAVLLRGVNDCLETQIALSHKLIQAGVSPYYLHQLDRVQGAAHFEVPVEEGKNLVLEMSRRLPGYAVPRYVQEIPFEKSKTRIL